MISILFWAVFGSVIGWVAAILQDETAPRRVAKYIVLGTIGGLIGGFGGVLLSPAEQTGSLSTTAIMFAVFGATAFVALAALSVQNNSRE
jgi:uncharacterized membrane protein YeaQ/YmgE (transglycosylase-associated protein family)